MQQNHFLIFTPNSGYKERWGFLLTVLSTAAPDIESRVSRPQPSRRTSPPPERHVAGMPFKDQRFQPQNLRRTLFAGLSSTANALYRRPRRRRAQRLPAGADASGNDSGEASSPSAGTRLSTTDAAGIGVFCGGDNSSILWGARSRGAGARGWGQEDGPATFLFGKEKWGDSAGRQKPTFGAAEAPTPPTPPEIVSSSRE